MESSRASSGDLSNQSSMKCVVIGDGAVGKTCMLMSYMYNSFPEEHVPTVFDNYATTVTVDNRPYTLGLWDTAGQDDYDRLRPLSYPQADIFLICFALNSSSSFEHVTTKWYPEMQQYCPGVPFILVGMKCDCRLESSRREPISRAKAEALCVQLKGEKYLECSAKTQQGLRQVFEEAVDIILYYRNPNERKSKCIVM